MYQAGAQIPLGNDHFLGGGAPSVMRPFIRILWPLVCMSGTYNNQYMVIDLKKVTLGRELANGTLWVIEQIPGLVVGADQTTVLRFGLSCTCSLRLQCFDAVGWAAGRASGL